MIDYITRGIDLTIDSLTKQEVKRITGVKPSYSMAGAIKLWGEIYNGRAYWGSEDIKQLNLLATISSKLAKVATIEMKSNVDNEAVDKVYQNVLNNIRIELEYGIAKGELYIKPFQKTNGEIDIEFIQPENCLPYKFENNGNILGVLFFYNEKINGYYYTRIEQHEKQGNDLLISHYLYKSRDTTLGKRIPLDTLEKYSNVAEVTRFKNVTGNLFGVFKVPMANNVDNNSKRGVSICSKCIGLLELADKQHSRIDWEFESKETAIYADSSMFRKNKLIPKFKKRIFKMLQTSDDNFFKEFSPEIRDVSMHNGLNKLKMEIEDSIGLSRGVISDANLQAKTATEIKSSKQEYYTLISDIQKNLKLALEQTAYAIGVLARVSNFEMTFSFDDSVVSDIETQNKQALLERNSGIIDDVQYFIQTRGYDEKDAIAFVENINKRKPIEEEGDGV